MATKELLMSEDKIIDEVREIIADLLGVDSTEVTPKSDFEEDLDADYLDRVEIVMSVEERYGITIPDEDACDINNLEQLMKYLVRSRSKS